MKRRVKKNVYPSPLTFEFVHQFINSALPSSSHHSPMLAGHPISALLYVVILSVSQVGMKRALRTLSSLCLKEQLVVNYQKIRTPVIA